MQITLLRVWSTTWFRAAIKYLELKVVGYGWISCEIEGGEDLRTPDEEYTRSQSRHLETLGAIMITF